jgi:hypothetical protein
MDETQANYRAQSQIASLVKSDIQDYVSAEKAAAIDKMVSLYRSGRLTPETCWGLVGEITGLDNLLNSLETDIKMGRDG